MAFESIKSSLIPYEKYKNIKSEKDLKLLQQLKKFQNNYWTAIPDKLLFNTSIDPQAKILWAILQYLGDENGYSYYSQESLAFFYGGCTKTIQRQIKKLVERSWLETKHGHKLPSNDYWVFWPPGCQNPKLKSAINKSKNKYKRN